MIGSRLKIIFQNDYRAPTARRKRRYGAVPATGYVGLSDKVASNLEAFMTQPDKGNR